MFIRNPHGSESIQALAGQLGMVFGETEGSARFPGRPGFIGDTFAHKDALKAAGAKWDGFEKAWTFATWADAEAALLSIINK